MTPSALPRPDHRPLQSLLRTPAPGRQPARSTSDVADNLGPRVKNAGPGIRGNTSAARSNPGHINSTLLDPGANATRAGHVARHGEPGAQAVYQLPGRAMRFGHGATQTRGSAQPSAPVGNAETASPPAANEGTPVLPRRTPGDPMGPAAQAQIAHVSINADHDASTLPGRALAESTPFVATSPGLPDVGHDARAEGLRTVIPMHFGTGYAGWLPRLIHGRKRAPARIRAQRRMVVWLTVAGLLLAWIALLAL